MTIEILPRQWSVALVVRKGRIADAFPPRRRSGSVGLRVFLRYGFRSLVNLYNSKNLKFNGLGFFFYFQILIGFFFFFPFLGCFGVISRLCKIL